MHKLLTALAGFALLATLTACEPFQADGPLVTEQRTVTGFSGVDLQISADVYFRQAPQYAVEVRAQDEVLEILQTYVSGGKLVVKFEEGRRVWRNDGITITVAGPELTSLRVGGSGDIYTSGAVQTPELKLEVSGSGDIKVADVTTTRMEAAVRGSGDITVYQGSATHEELRISSSGSINNAGLEARTANVRTSGSGNTRLRVTDRLDVTISGSGNVWYSGAPQVNAQISGSGKVRAQ